MKFNRKTLKIGSFTLISTAIVLAVLIFVNLFISELPLKFTNFDTTPEKLYDELSDESLTLLDNLSAPVEIYLISESEMESSQTTHQIKTFIEKYAQSNENITFEIIDPVLHPNFGSEYTEETLTQNSVLVVSEKRSRLIAGNTWYMYDLGDGTYLDEETYAMYYSYGQLSGTDPILFFGEKNVTGAIDYVTASKISKAYVLTNHSETEISAEFLSYLDEDNINYEAISLMTGDGTVPADADFIIINVPKKDLHQDECDALLTYFNNGGNIILVTSFDSYSKELMPNLAKLTETMGLTSVDGIIMEGDTRYYYQYPFYIVPDIGSSAPFSTESLSGTQVFAPSAHGITKAEGTGNTVFEILTTSEKAYLKPDFENSETAEKEENDIDGPFCIGAAACPANSDNSSGIVWIAAPYFLDINSDYGGGNSAFFAETVKWMADKDASVSLLSIDGKNIDASLLMTTEGAVIGWGFALIVAIPVLILGAGLFVWISRRRK